MVGDHPRTRGVYGDGQGEAVGELRIIPAHAGFTARFLRKSSHWGDHPRTRGVYVPLPQDHAAVTGSSPHTRGLPNRPLSVDFADGIIPAHAGFTPRTSARRPWWADHPRTRGVYWAAYRPGRWTWGSSPHTRGLRPRLRGAVKDAGIIPAHAGFTRRCVASCAVCRDHPRTRGVYSRPSTGASPAGGSSPHTRGLP